ncbi:bile acid:sodium symporter family protein [Myxosarcina sp. GI1(2024)]
MSIISPSSPFFQAFVSITIFTFVLSLGMSLSLAQLREFWQQKGLVIRTLVATVVLPPLLLALLILTVDLPKPVPIALALLMAAPGPPLLTQRISQAGVSRELALDMQVTLALMTIIATPLILSLFQAGFPDASDVSLDIWLIVKKVALVQFLPLGIGFAIHQVRAEWVEKLAAILNKVSQVLLLILVLALLILLISTKLLLTLGWLPFLAIALFNVLLLAIGHVLASGYAKQFQASVAIASIARNLGLAIFIATSLARADAILTILVAQIIGIIVNLPYTQWIKRR